MKKDRYLSHSIALCSAAVMMFVFFPSLVERQICSSSSVDKQHEKMLQDFLSKVTKSFPTPGVETVILHRPTKYQLAWYEFIKNEKNFDRGLSSYLTLRAENHKLKSALYSRLYYFFCLPAYIGAFGILIYIGFCEKRRMRNEKSFFENKLPLVERQKLGLSAQLSAGQKLELENLLFLILRIDEVIRKIFKEKTATSPNFKVLRKHLRNLFLDMHDAGITQFESAMPRSVLLKQAGEIFSNELAAIRENDFQRKKEQEAAFDAKCAKLELAEQEIQQKIDEGVTKRVNEARSKISNLLAEIKTLKAVVVKWSTWKDEQRKQKVELEERKRKLKEQEDKLSSDQLLLNSRLHALQNSKHKRAHKA